MTKTALNLNMALLGSFHTNPLSTLSQFHQHFARSFFIQFLQATLLILYFRSVLFWHKNIVAKSALRMLVKVTLSLRQLSQCLILWKKAFYNLDCYLFNYHKLMAIITKYKLLNLFAQLLRKITSTIVSSYRSLENSLTFWNNLFEQSKPGVLNTWVLIHFRFEGIYFSVAKACKIMVL